VWDIGSVRIEAKVKEVLKGRYPGRRRFIWRINVEPILDL
jgi:hypothetical protein